MQREEESVRVEQSTEATVSAERAPEGLHHGYTALVCFAVLAIFAYIVFATDYGRTVVFELSTQGAVAAFAHDTHTADAVEDVLRKPMYVRDALFGEAAYVLDVESETELYAYNADRALPLASITKVVTALAVRDVLGPDERVRIPEAHVTTEGYDSLRDGEVWSVSALTDFMLLTSSNRAARALESRSRQNEERLYSDRSFVDFMERVALRAGMRNATFVNVSGLDVDHETRVSNTASARDVGRLFAYVVEHHPTLLEATEYSATTLSSETGTVHTARTTNKALAEIPGLIGGKTGYTDNAGGSLAIVFDVEPGRPVVVVVLASGKEERFADTVMLVESVRNHFGMVSKKEVHLPI